MIKVYRFTTDAMDQKAKLHNGESHNLTSSQQLLFKTQQMLAAGATVDVWLKYGLALTNELKLTNGILVEAASVNTATLFEYLALTNTNDKPWMTNAEIIVTEDSAAMYSTSVGDLCMKDDRFYIWTPFGFIEVSERVSFKVSTAGGVKHYDLMRPVTYRNSKRRGKLGCWDGNITPDERHIFHAQTPALFDAGDSWKTTLGTVKVVSCELSA